MAPIPIPGGLLIVVEGIDGAGKTTLARTLKRELEQTGAAVSLSKEPTAGPWGMQMRASAADGRLAPAEELRLLLLDRHEHVETLVLPALGRGDIVILDRYFPSNVAYQGAAGISVDDLMAANDFAPRPDLLILLDLDPETGLARIHARGDKPNHFETPGNLSMCRSIFLDLGLANTVKIDANRSADDVAASARDHVTKAIARKVVGVHGATPAGGDILLGYLPPIANS
ncbi:dTMP kinase [Luteibacter sp. HA06]